MDPNAYISQQQHSHEVPQYGFLSTNPYNTAQSNPPNTTSNPLDDLSPHGYPLTTSPGQADEGPTQSITKNVYRLARDPTHHGAHAAHAVENGWSAPLQSLQQGPAPIVKSNNLDSHLYTREQ